MLVAQVSDGKLQLGGLLDRYKVNVDKYKEIIESFKQLDINSKKFTDTKAMDAYTEAKKNANAVNMDETPVSLSISQTIDQLNTQLKPAFDSLKSAYQDIFTDDVM